MITSRIPRKYIVGVVLGFIVLHIISLEITHVLLHIILALSTLTAICYGVNYLTNFLLTSRSLSRSRPHDSPPSSPRPHHDSPPSSPKLHDSPPSTSKSHHDPPTPSSKSHHDPPVSYSRNFILMALLVGTACVRTLFAPGFIVFGLTMVCFACLVLLYGENVPTAVSWLLFAFAWWILCYKWLLWEICRENMYIGTNTCTLSWTYNPIVLILIGARPWIKKYGANWKEYIFKSFVLFPCVFGFFFFCSWWCLVSVNTFWTHGGNTYTKADVLHYIPAEFSLGGTPINSMFDVYKIPKESYPVFFKPNQCSGGGRGICPIDNQEQAIEYLRIRNDERPEKSTLMQTFHRTGGEATVIYYRFPYFSTGVVKTVWLKIANVSFDWTDLRARIKRVSDGPEYIYQTRDHIPTPIAEDIAASPALARALDKISHAVPGLTVYRLDVKYESEAELKKGKFKIVEVDMPPFGDRSEKTKASDASQTTPTWLLAAKQVRTVAVLFYIGFGNIAMGNTPGLLSLPSHVPKLVNIAYMCEYKGSMSPVTPGIQ